MIRRLLLLASCTFGCADGTAIDEVRPRLEIDQRLIDFGAVPRLSTGHRSLVVSNRGSAPLELTGLSADAPFAINAAVSELAPGATATLELAFNPEEEVASSGTLRFTTNDRDRPVVDIALAGTGVTRGLEVRPGTLDFGSLPSGNLSELRFALGNHGIDAVRGTLRPVGVARPTHFTVDGVSTQALELEVPPNGLRVVSVVYAPTAPGNDDARLLFEWCGESCGLEIRILASAYAGELEISPAHVDFGAVPFGGSLVREVSLKNNGGAPLTITRSRLPIGVAKLGGVPEPFSIAGGASAVVRLEYTPDLAPELASRVRFETSLGEAQVTVAGHGEGPLFVASPSTLDFGVVPRPASQRRAVVLSNQGSGPLAIQGIELSGSARLTLEHTTTLPARLGRGESMTVYVRFTPLGETLEEATLRLRSDDRERPTIEIPVRARFELPPCGLTWSPGQVDFGVVPVGIPKRSSLRVENFGDAPCTIIGGEIAGDPGFAHLAQWPLAIEAGASRMIELTARFGSELGDQRANLLLTTAGGAVLRVPMTAFAGKICDGTFEACGCPNDYVLMLHRFDDPSSASGVFSPAQMSPFLKECVPAEGRASDALLVETEVGEYTEIAGPAPRCAENEGLEWSGTELVCVPCAYVVQYGFLFDGKRVCASAPPEERCPRAGEVPTFDADEKSWFCRPECDNGLYDRIMIASGLVCVPC